MFRDIYRKPKTSTHDKDGSPYIILDMDEAQTILHALETAVKVAPCEGGTPVVVAEADAPDFYRWACVFADGLATINQCIADCLATPDKPVEDAAAPAHA